jgi:hypothetical protein
MLENTCRILVFRGDDYEECRLLGCGAVRVLEPTFRRNVELADFSTLKM